MKQSQVMEKSKQKGRHFQIVQSSDEEDGQENRMSVDEDEDKGEAD